MPKIDGRKYEVELDDGRVVSRQYYHYMLNKETYNERRRQKRYTSVERRSKSNEYNKRWRDKFKEENGISYWKHHKQRRNNESSHQKPASNEGSSKNLQP